MLRALPLCRRALARGCTPAFRQIASSCVKWSEAEPRRVRIYTRTGDKGTSSLYTGERRRKDDAVFETLGTTDELTSLIGLAREHCLAANLDLDTYLHTIQCTLQDLGSHIATPPGAATPARLERTQFPAARASELEQWIDTLDAELPPLTNFILPSGGLAAAALHCARSVCRRAERCALTVDHLSPAALQYLNRLSDFLFVAARTAAARAGRTELIYRSRPSAPD